MTDVVAHTKDGQSDVDWLRRFALYELLVLSFSNPTQRFAQAIASGEYAHALLELLSLNGCAEKVAASLVRAADERDPLTPMRAGYERKTAEEIMQYVNTEYLRLFIGAPHPLIAPYPVVEAAEESGNPRSEEDIVSFYERYDFAWQEVNEEPNHIATELAFLTYLAGVQAGVVEKDVKDADTAHDQFLSDYFDRETQEFAREIMRLTQEPVYRMAAAVLTALVK